MRRRELVKMLLGLTAAPLLLSLGAERAAAQPAAPMLPSGSEPAAPTTPAAGSDPDAAPPAAGPDAAAPENALPVRPLPTVMAQGPIPNNIVGLNVARLHQPIYVWATSDAVNANGGDWGYITVVWTIEDREARNAEYNLQQFLDRCFEHHVQPIVRVATRFTRSTKPGNQPPGSQGADGSWSRPDWDEPEKWRAFFERANWPARRTWVIVGNEPNLGREWGDAVDATSYARYLAHFLDVFADAPRFGVVSGALDISNTTRLPEMQDALEFLDQMNEAVPGIFERLPAWASNPYRVISGGPGARYTHLAYEAEFDHIGREMPVLITEAGHLETGDELEIARFYAEAFRDWMADPKVVAATPLFWHPDRNDFWMFEIDSKNRFVYKSPTYELLRVLPRVAGSPEFTVTLGNTARTTPFETPAVADEPEAPDETGEPAPTGAGPTPPRHPDGDRPEDDSEVPEGHSTGPGTQAPGASGAGRLVLRIANTGGAGALLRSAPSLDADPVALLPDGAIVQALGPASQSEDRDWRPVRSSEGAEGWVAVDLLAPAENAE